MLLHQSSAAPESVKRALTLLGIVAAVRPVAGPNSLSMELSTTCNFACLICPYHSPLAYKKIATETQFVKTEVAARILEGAASLGVRSVGFGGRGEPMLHPDFASIVRASSRLGIQTRVFTNGSLLAPERVTELVDAGLGTIAVHMMAARPDTYARLLPDAPRETFQTICDSITLLQELKARSGRSLPRLDLRFIAVDGSSREVDQMVDLGIKLRADSVSLLPLRYRASLDCAAFTPTLEEERRAVERLKGLVAKGTAAGLQVNVDEMMVNHVYGPVSGGFPCYASWVEICADVDGGVPFCVRSREAIGNVTERPLDEIWLSPQFNFWRRQAKNPSQRSKLGDCECERCCLFYTNWNITRRLSAFGLAPKIKPSGECRRQAPHAV